MPKISPDDLTDDQKEYIRIVQLGQNEEDTFAVVRKIAPRLTSFTKIDIAIALNYMINEILEEHPDAEYLERVREDVAKVGTSLFYIKGTHIDRKAKSDNNTKGE